MATQSLRIAHHPILDPPEASNTVTIYYDGTPIEALEGEPIASALMSAGVRTFRHTVQNREPRGIFCAIGRCTDCMMVVDGRRNTRTCVTPVRDGMRVEHQYGHGEEKG